MHDSNYTNIFFILSHLCEQFFTYKESVDLENFLL